MRNLIAQTKVGKIIQLMIFRGGKTRILSVNVAKLPEKLSFLEFENYNFPAN